MLGIQPVNICEKAIATLSICKNVNKDSHFILIYPIDERDMKTAN